MIEEVFRTLVGRFNESVRGYLKPSRRPSRLPIQISIEPSTQTTSVLKHRLADVYPERKKNLSVAGETADLSKEGLSFIVPFIRLGERYLVSDGTVLNVEIELPNGKLNLKAIGCRYEQIDMESSIGRYLVGARIVRMSEKDKVLLADYLEAAKGGRREKVKNVEWGLDLPRS
jgi:hypothetical protein